MRLLIERAGIRAHWNHHRLRVRPDDVAQVRVFMDFLSDIPDDVVLELAEASHFDPLPVQRSPAAPVPRRTEDLPVPDVAMPRYRLGVFLVDGVLVGAVTIPLYRSLGSPLGAVFSGAIGAVYAIVMVHVWGQTIGNMVTRTRVAVLDDRLRPSWWAATVRWLVANAAILLTGVPGATWLGVLWQIAVYFPVVVAPEYRGLHDRLAGVVVLDDRLTPAPGFRPG